MTAIRFRDVFVVGVATVVSAVMPLSAQAAPGDLDAGFGSGGKVTTAIGARDSAHAVVVQGDGKIVAAGGCSDLFCLARYDGNGALDNSFDGDGKVTTAIGAGDSARAVAVQGNGKIVAAGSCSVGTTEVFCLARYNGDGSLDPSFDGDGKAGNAIGANDRAFAVAVQGDGKIVAAGTCSTGSTSLFCLARFNGDGSFDASFDTDGKVMTPIGADDGATAVAVQADGKIVAAGHCLIGSTNVFCLARYNGDGSLDLSFDGDGKAAAIGFSGLAAAVALQADRKIVVAGGCSSSGFVLVFCLARLNGDGSLDSSFDVDGKVLTPFGITGDRAHAVAVQGDGKIVAAGTCDTGPGRNFCLARYNGDGSLDVSFGVGGRAGTSIGADDSAEAVAVQSDGRIVVAGGCRTASVLVFCLARFIGAKAAQSITFGAPAARTFGDPDFAVSASASSGLPVSFAASGSCTVSGTTVHVTRAGSCTLTASQAGDANYAPAPEVARTFAIAPARCVVPRLVGKRLASAKVTLKKAHCRTGRVRYAYSRKVKRGLVLSQSRRAKRVLAANSKVDLVVSRGRER